MTVIASLAWTWHTRRQPLPLAILTIGAAVLGYVLYRTFPVPRCPVRLGRARRCRQRARRGGHPLTPGLLTRMRNSRLLAVTATAGALPPASRADRPRPEPGTHQQQGKDQCQQPRP